MIRIVMMLATNAFAHHGHGPYCIHRSLCACCIVVIVIVILSVIVIVLFLVDVLVLVLVVGHILIEFCCLVVLAVVISHGPLWKLAKCLRPMGMVRRR